jgi:hypothetical protein
MRATLFVIAAGAMLAASVPASSVSAQGVTIEGPGVGVRVGRDRDREDWRDRRRGERRYYRERETFGEGREGRGCRTVSVRETLPNGTVVTRRRSSC